MAVQCRPGTATSMVGICQGETEIPLPPGKEARNQNEGHGRGQVLNRSAAIRDRSVTRHPFAGSRQTPARHRRLSCSLHPPAPKQSGRHSSVTRLPSRGSARSGGNLSQQQRRCEPGLHPDESGRLFLDRVGRHQSPSPLGRQKKVTRIDLRCLKKRTPQAGADAAKKARSAASRYATSLRATASVARLAWPLCAAWS
jgi:hypothetical protein